MKKLITLFVSCCFALYSWAGNGWFDDYIIINANNAPSASYYWVGSNPSYGIEFHNHSFGEVTSLILTGSDFKYWSNIQDRTGGAFYYKIETNTGNPVVSDIEILWTHSYTGGNDYQGTWSGPIDLLSGLAAGSYKLSIWAKHWGAEGDNWLNNGGSNYVATFTIPDLGISDSYVYIGTEPTSAVWYNAQGTGQAESFVSKNLGDFTTDLYLGGEIKTISFSGVSSYIHYHITNNSDVSETGSSEMTWISNPSSDVDLWQNTAGKNILGGLSLPVGTYDLEVWFTAKTGDIIQYDSNMSSNYVASFTIEDTSTSLNTNKSIFSITTDNNQICARFDGTKQICLYSVSGQQLYSGTADSQFTYPAKPGIYLLRMNDEVHKVSVK